MKLISFIKLIIPLIILVGPTRLALPSIPDQPIFKHTGNGELVLYNTHTEELLEIIYKDKEGTYLEKGIKDVNYILRCRLSGKETEMSLELIELLDKIQDHFNVDEIEVISGFRSPELNSSLRTEGRGVAKRSHHLKGMAIDIRIPGISTREVRDYARSLKAGGVGFYPGPDFVHIDIGPVRTW